MTVEAEKLTIRVSLAVFDFEGREYAIHHDYQEDETIDETSERAGWRMHFLVRHSVHSRSAPDKHAWARVGKWKLMVEVHGTPIPDDGLGVVYIGTPFTSTFIAKEMESWDAIEQKARSETEELCRQALKAANAA